MSQRMAIMCTFQSHRVRPTIIHLLDLRHHCQQQHGHLFNVVFLQDTTSTSLVCTTSSSQCRIVDLWSVAVARRRRRQKNETFTQSLTLWHVALHTLLNGIHLLSFELSSMCDWMCARVCVSVEVILRILPLDTNIQNLLFTYCMHAVQRLQSLYVWRCEDVALRLAAAASWCLQTATRDPVWRVCVWCACSETIRNTKLAAPHTLQTHTHIHTISANTAGVYSGLSIYGRNWRTATIANGSREVIVGAAINAIVRAGGAHTSEENEIANDDSAVLSLLRSLCVYVYVRNRRTTPTHTLTHTGTNTLQVNTHTHMHERIKRRSRLGFDACQKTIGVNQSWRRRDALKGRVVIWCRVASRRSQHDDTDKLDVFLMGCFVVSRIRGCDLREGVSECVSVLTSRLAALRYE